MERTLQPALGILLVVLSPGTGFCQAAAAAARALRGPSAPGVLVPMGAAGTRSWQGQGSPAGMPALALPVGQTFLPGSLPVPAVLGNPGALRAESLRLPQAVMAQGRAMAAPSVAREVAPEDDGGYTAFQALEAGAAKIAEAARVGRGSEFGAFDALRRVFGESRLTQGSDGQVNPAVETSQAGYEGPGQGAQTPGRETGDAALRLDFYGVSFESIKQDERAFVLEGPGRMNMFVRVRVLKGADVAETKLDDFFITTFHPESKQAQAERPMELLELLGLDSALLRAMDPTRKGQPDGAKAAYGNLQARVEQALDKEELLEYDRTIDDPWAFTSAWKGTAVKELPPGGILRFAELVDSNPADPKVDVADIVVDPNGALTVSVLKGLMRTAVPDSAGRVWGPHDAMKFVELWQYTFRVSPEAEPGTVITISKRSGREVPFRILVKERHTGKGVGELDAARGYRERYERAYKLARHTGGLHLSEEDAKEFADMVARSDQNPLEAFLKWPASKSARAARDGQLLLWFKKSAVIDVGGLKAEVAVTDDDIAALLKRYGLEIIERRADGAYRVAAANGEARAIAAALSKEAIVLSATAGKGTQLEGRQEDELESYPLVYRDSAVKHIMEDIDDPAEKRTLVLVRDRFLPELGRAVVAAAAQMLDATRDNLSRLLDAMQARLLAGEAIAFVAPESARPAAEQPPAAPVERKALPRKLGMALYFATSLALAAYAGLATGTLAGIAGAAALLPGAGILGAVAVGAFVQKVFEPSDAAIIVALALGGLLGLLGAGAAGYLAGGHSASVGAAVAMTTAGAAMKVVEHLLWGTARNLPMRAGRKMR